MIIIFEYPYSNIHHTMEFFEIGIGLDHAHDEIV